ncbi:MAG: glycoside hydrolase family 88 protein [Paludibacteraceae bacterium]|nr:glycoside hydrolase family 88 protein [Paludibacteraceae bacterium]
MKRILLILAVLCSLSLQAKTPKHESAYYLSYARMFANSQMENNPELWRTDGVKQPKWDYTQALMAKAMLQVYQATGDERYMKYVMEFADFFISSKGDIKTYKMSDFNIDRVNGGSFLYVMNDIHPEKRWMLAADRLYRQLEEQPRTKEGGFWHKKIYPWQMWLDGLYMAEPFYIRYAVEHNMDKGVVDVANQFRFVDKHTYDKKTGLNYHGWDESKEQKWADPETGCSPNFWSRSMGWYIMAMVDVLDYMPEGQERQDILKMLRRTAKNLLKYQDKKSHMWYQLTALPKEEGNYLEATSSAIFCYAFAKAANKGYLPKKYKKEAQKIFDGMVENVFVFNDNNTVDLTNCCAVAGLGGKPVYRDGSVKYYLNEPIIKNDPKGVGPIIFAALELAK